ncbi:hypothetical protein Sste5346_006197 [Sporothrix stenoceras]|uniref:DUF3604 domain-containing protein n=1 Tax=Sporothrix stenoceras TaxID=5173 RepID=A0ABR3Z093_9PEZI
MDVPKFEDLPSIPGGPRGCAWEVWNNIHAQTAVPGKDGKKLEKDGLGTLNHLTATVVSAAGKEIQTGDRAALNWPLDAYVHVGFGRKKLDFKLIDGFEVTNGLLLANDDEISFNTQISSQWDGLCHFAHQKTKVYYNGATHEEMQAGRDRPGSVHAGGICGRGVLIDYYAYAQTHKIQYSPGETIAISVADVEAVAAWEGVTFQPGDILVLRTGWTQWHDALKDDDPAKFIVKTHNAHNNAGLLAGEETAAWLWNRRFAAAAGDNPTLESWPPSGGQMLHEYLLPMLGCPIGELWDLEELSKMCAKNKRYSFFLASAPLNVFGAIASPANVFNPSHTADALADVKYGACRWGRGVVVPGGQDNQVVAPDLSTKIDTQYLLKTDDDEPAYITVYTEGWRTGPADVLARLFDPAQADGVAPSDYRFRLYVHLETGDARYQLLCTGMWVASGARLRSRVLYDVYRIQ